MECSIENVLLKISQIHRKKPVLKSLFNKVNRHLAGNFLGRILHKCSVNLAKKKLRTGGRVKTASGKLII